MEKYELTQDWVKKNAEKVKLGYSLISSEKYDINSFEDVLKVLKIVDPENANEENAKVFSMILRIFGKQVSEKFTPAKEEKTNN